MALRTDLSTESVNSLSDLELLQPEEFAFTVVWQFSKAILIQWLFILQKRRKHHMRLMTIHEHRDLTIHKPPIGGLYGKEETRQSGRKAQLHLQTKGPST
ncbi:hypothetical protein [Aeromonas veronii]|uniref:hypothetical protein n=1 Tax=Aeromonas veronii TaxID=654 RepID=UPI003CE95710